MQQSVSADTIALMQQSISATNKCGAVAEWSKAHAWKVCIRQPRIEGSNPSCSATYTLRTRDEVPSGAFFLFGSKGFNEAMRLSETNDLTEICL